MKQETIQLKNAYNVILHGPPGTGKTYLAQQMAAEIVSDGAIPSIQNLPLDARQRIKMVQFHPGYDYTDFIEGLRPVQSTQGDVGFQLVDGIFKQFVQLARSNYERATRPLTDAETTQHEMYQWEQFISDMQSQRIEQTTVTGTHFHVAHATTEHIYISVPTNTTRQTVRISLEQLQDLIFSKQTFEQVKDVAQYFNREKGRHEDSYLFALYQLFAHRLETEQTPGISREPLQSYVFIIDEMNRGELSAIFGETFFAIDPEYRGPNGRVQTQFANLHPPTTGDFYVPPNVYVIGTMNEIDRSIEPFDFAMQRRFLMIERTAQDSLFDFGLPLGVRQQAERLNHALLSEGQLSPDYHIGASYFKDLAEPETKADAPVWTYRLRPLIKNYLRGNYQIEQQMARIESKYFGSDPS